MTHFKFKRYFKIFMFAQGLWGASQADVAGCTCVLCIRDWKWTNKIPGKKWPWQPFFTYLWCASWHVGILANSKLGYAGEQISCWWTLAGELIKIWLVAFEVTLAGHTNVTYGIRSWDYWGVWCTIQGKQLHLYKLKIQTGVVVPAPKVSVLLLKAFPEWQKYKSKHRVETLSCRSDIRKWLFTLLAVNWRCPASCRLPL